MAEHRHHIQICLVDMKRCVVRAAFTRRIQFFDSWLICEERASLLVPFPWFGVQGLIVSIEDSVSRLAMAG
jgi:hypothetical protein